MELVDVFDDIVENVGTTTESKGDLRYEEM